MKPNIGSLDRVIRIVLGCALLGAGWYFHNAWGLIGLLPLITGFVRFCPAYLPFGLSTCGAELKSPPQS